MKGQEALRGKGREKGKERGKKKMKDKRVKGKGRKGVKKEDQIE